LAVPSAPAHDLSAPTWTLANLAFFLRVKERTIHRRMRTDPRFPQPFRCSTRWLWYADEIRAYAENCRLATRGGVA
jgi:hypothetical protein